MTFAELQTELASRGFDYLSAARRQAYLNRAYHLLAEAMPWDFLHTTTSGTAPLTISDLGQVLSATDTTNDTSLVYLDRRSIIEADHDLDDTGDPTHFFIDNTTLRVWPLNTSSTITVRYVKVPSDLSSDSHEPVIPSRYQLLIVDRAAVMAYRDSDNPEMADSLKAGYDEEVREMVHSLMHRNYATPEVMMDTSPFYARNC